MDDETAPPPDEVPEAVLARLRGEHADLLATASDCADAVAAGFEEEVDGTRATAERERVVGPMRLALERAGALSALPGVLADVAAAVGRPLPAAPVAAPPYVVVTATGPTMRATLSDGRLVVSLETFALRRDPVRYVRRAVPPEELPTVRFRR